MSALKGTIKPTDEISLFFKDAQRTFTDTIMALQKRKNLKRGTSSRVAYIAGKKLGSAPERNKLKRWMREAKREVDITLSSYDVIYVARKGIGSSCYKDYLKDMETINKRIARLDMSE